MTEKIDNAVQDLVRSQAAGRLAHAYVVWGPPRGAGRTLAVKALQSLFCEQGRPGCGACGPCRKVAAQRHPDIVWLEPQGKGRVISVEDIRPLNLRLAQTAFGGGWKGAVLIHAERMTDGAANAFLKTLEEPSPRSLLFLLTEHPSLLLPTIRSRCQRILLHAGARPPDGPWMAELLDLLRRGPPADPLDALTLAAAADQLLKQVVKEISEEERRGLADREDIQEDVMEGRVRSRVKEVQEAMVRSMQCWHRDILVLSAGGGEGGLYFPDDVERLRQLASVHTPPAALASVQAVDQAARKLDQGLPALIVFETLFVEQGRAAQSRR